MSSPPESARPLAAKRDRTRATLIRAALDQLDEVGIAGMSLEAIAARAGMTKGAIYSNFGGKADLLLAALRAKGLVLTPPPAPPRTLAEAIAQMADGLGEMVRRASGDAAVLVEFQAHALADPDLRAGLATLYADNFTATAEAFAGLPDAPAGLPARHLAVALQAIGLGFTAQSLLTPDEVTAEVIGETLRAFAAGLGLATDSRGS